MSNIVTKLKERSKRDPGQSAYLFLGEGEKETASLTYQELDKNASIIASYLQSKNMSVQCVILLYPAGLDFISAFMGCLYAGVIAVPVTSIPLTESKKLQALINKIAENANIVGVLTCTVYEEFIKKILDPKKIVIINTATIKHNHSEFQTLPKILPNKIAYLQYSSGSLAEPKGAIIRHKNLMHSLKYSALAWHYTKKSVTLTWAPHSHVYGLVCGLLTPLYTGSIGIIMPTESFVKRPSRWLKAISQYQVTHSGCPNFGYEMCIRDIPLQEIKNIDLTSWVVAVNGGENVQYQTLKRFVQKFKKYGFQLNHFCSAYGMSEMAGTVAVNEFNSLPTIFNLDTQKVGSGKLLPGIEAVIVNPDSLNPVDAGEVGEIWLAGKSLISGYWHPLKIKDVSFHAKLPQSKHLYFRTGDIGFIKKGELCITARLKELIIIHGKKYSPQDLELSVKKVIERYSDGNTCAIFSLPSTTEEEIIVLQEVNKNLNLDLQNKIFIEIRHALAEQYGISITEIILVTKNTLPRTSSGKLQRRLCKQYFLENSLKIVNRDLKENNLVSKDIHKKLPSVDNKFIKIVAEVLKLSVNDIDLNFPLSHYKFDSITIMQLTEKINNHYHLILTPDIFYLYPNLSQFYHQQIQFKKSSSKIGKKVISNSHDIAIIGINGIFPGAHDVEIFWNNMLAQLDVIQEIPKERWDWTDEKNKTQIKWGGFIDGMRHFDADFFNMSRREAELTDPQQRLFLQVVWNAIEDAGYSINELARYLTGLYVGVFNNDYAELLQKKEISDAYVTTGTTHSVLANRVSYLLNLQGPSEAIDTACSSSLVAIHNAVQAIINGDCEVAIVGGVNALLTPTTYLMASKAGMLSADGKCKTFDKAANGYVRSEGVAAIILKPLPRAIEEGDHIYAVIKGSAVNHGGHVSSLTVPNPNAQADVIANAWRRAKLPVESISYIETHGTGTSLGDPIEISGLKKAFEMLGDEQQSSSLHHSYCGLGAVKTHIGHLEAAAGIASVIKVLLAMKYKMLPGNLHLKEINPYINLNETPFYLVNDTQPWERLKDKAGNQIKRRAGISSFGYGGTNAHIVIEEWMQPDIHNSENIIHPYLISLSAKSDTALQARKRF